jgi:hypothetical protein
MGRIMIKCPVKNVPVPTGMAMGKQAFDSSMFVNNTSSCPACGGMHTWSKEQAWLEEAN